MSKRNEPERFSGSNSAINASITQNSFCSIPSEQNLCVSAGVCVHPRELYLTYTDKSTSKPDFSSVKQEVTFEKESLNLYIKTKNLYNNDKKVLQNLHALGFQKLKFINDNNLVLYTNSNPAGNSHSGWELAKEDSNTDKARLASKQSAWEKAMCNTDIWAYFATFTFDKTKHDRYDFKKCRDHVVRFLRSRHIKYFTVPERHKDGAWHFHALLSAEVEPYLRPFQGKALKNTYIKNRLAQGVDVQNFESYGKSFGYNTCEKIIDVEKCTYYVIKYVIKTFDDKNFERVSRRRFFTSIGLKSPRIVMPIEIDLNDFELSALSKYTQKCYLKRLRPKNLPSSGMFSLPSPPIFSLNRTTG